MLEKSLNYWKLKWKKIARDYPLTEKTDNLGDALIWVAEWVAEYMAERIGLRDGWVDG